MNTQGTTSFEQLESGRARHLGRLGGEMTVLSGQIWLTRDGVTGDHFLNAGDTVRIAVDECAVIESVSREAATLRWTPRRQSVVGRILAEPLLGVAFVARLAALAVAWLAESVTAAARRAQGCIDTPNDLAQDQCR